jgi:hypothetical protein
MALSRKNTTGKNTKPQVRNQGSEAWVAKIGVDRLVSRANCPGGTTEASQAQSHRCWLESRQAFIGQPRSVSE